MIVRYINTLLEEVLDDTVKHVADLERNNVRHSGVTWKGMENGSGDHSRSHKDPDKSKDGLPIRRDGDGSFLDVDPPFPVDQTEEQWNTENECKKPFARVSIGEGYVNPAFVASTDQLSSLHFDPSTEKQSKRDRIVKSIALDLCNSERITCLKCCFHPSL